MESKIFDNNENPESLNQWIGKELTSQQKTAIKQYGKFHRQNKHKMISIPTFKL